MANTSGSSGSRAPASANELVRTESAIPSLRKAIGWAAFNLGHARAIESSRNGVASGVVNRLYTIHGLLPIFVDLLQAGHLPGSGGCLFTDAALCHMRKHVWACNDVFAKVQSCLTGLDSAIVSKKHATSFTQRSNWAQPMAALCDFARDLAALVTHARLEQLRRLQDHSLDAEIRRLQETLTRRDYINTPAALLPAEQSAACQPMNSVAHIARTGAARDQKEHDFLELAHPDLGGLYGHPDFPWHAPARLLDICCTLSSAGPTRSYEECRLARYCQRLPTEATKLKPAASEPAKPERVASKAIKSEPAAPESVEFESVTSKSVGSESVASESGDSEPPEAEPAKVEKVDKTGGPERPPITGLTTHPAKSQSMPAQPMPSPSVSSEGTEMPQESGSMTALRQSLESGAELEAYLIGLAGDRYAKAAKPSYIAVRIPVAKEQLIEHVEKLGPDYSVIEAFIYLDMEQVRLITSHVEERKGTLLAVKASTPSRPVSRDSTETDLGSVMFIMSTMAPHPQRRKIATPHGRGLSTAARIVLAQAIRDCDEGSERAGTPDTEASASSYKSADTTQSPHAESPKTSMFGNIKTDTAPTKSLFSTSSDLLSRYRPYPQPGPSTAPPEAPPGTGLFSSLASARSSGQFAPFEKKGSNIMGTFSSTSPAGPPAVSGVQGRSMFTGPSNTLPSGQGSLRASTSSETPSIFSRALGTGVGAATTSANDPLGGKYGVASKDGSSNRDLDSAPVFQPFNYHAKPKSEWFSRGPSPAGTPRSAVELTSTATSSTAKPGSLFGGGASAKPTSADANTSRPFKSMFGFASTDPTRTFTAHASTQTGTRTSNAVPQFVLDHLADVAEAERKEKAAQQQAAKAAALREIETLSAKMHAAFPTTAERSASVPDLVNVVPKMDGQGASQAVSQFPMRGLPPPRIREPTPPRVKPEAAAPRPTAAPAPAPAPTLAPSGSAGTSTNKPRDKDAAKAADKAMEAGHSSSSKAQVKAKDKDKDRKVCSRSGVGSPQSRSPPPPRPRNGTTGTSVSGGSGGDAGGRSRPHGPPGVKVKKH